MEKDQDCQVLNILNSSLKCRWIECKDCIYTKCHAQERKGFYEETFKTELPKLTAEVFNRPDCPKWALLASINEDGSAYYWAWYPRINEKEHRWMAKGLYNWRQIEGAFDASDWQNSLISRAKAQPTEADIEQANKILAEAVEASPKGISGHYDPVTCTNPKHKCPFDEFSCSGCRYYKTPAKEISKQHFLRDYKGRFRKIAKTQVLPLNLPVELTYSPSRGKLYYRPVYVPSDKWYEVAHPDEPALASVEDGTGEFTLLYPAANGLIGRPVVRCKTGAVGMLLYVDLAKNIIKISAEDVYLHTYRKEELLLYYRFLNEDSRYIAEVQLNK